MVELADELGPRVELFGYQRILIHGSAPSVRSVMALSIRQTGRSIASRSMASGLGSFRYVDCPGSLGVL